MTTTNEHTERAELPQRGTADEQAKDLWVLYLTAAKISGSSLLANEPCPESDKAALYRIACDVLNGIGCVYYDITGEWPNLNAPHKAAAMPEAQRPTLKPMTADQARLCEFYGVNDLGALVEAQARQIEKLQSRMPTLRDEQPQVSRFA